MREYETNDMIGSRYGLVWNDSKHGNLWYGKMMPTVIFMHEAISQNFDPILFSFTLWYPFENNMTIFICYSVSYSKDITYIRNDHSVKY